MTALCSSKGEALALFHSKLSQLNVIINLHMEVKYFKALVIVICFNNF